MRIGFISTYPPIECGIGTYTYSLNEALRDLREETFVISPFGAQGESVFPVYLTESPSFATDVFHTSIRLTPDIMHIQHEFGLYGSFKGVEVIGLMLRYRLAGIPFVLTLHTVPDEKSKEEFLLLKYLFNESAALIVHEEVQKVSLASYFGNSDKVHVIDHGIRETHTVPGAKEKLGLSGKHVILLAGYFRETKGFHHIVDIFPEICREDKDAVLVIAGKTRNIQYDDYRQELYRMIDASPVKDRIQIYRGQFPQHTFDTLLSAADVMALPYEAGGQSGILCQSFAMGNPVVVSGLPAFKAAINRSGGGIACESREDYINGILKILNDQAFAKRLRTNITRYVEEKAGWSLIAAKHREIYQPLVDNPSQKGRHVHFPEE